MEEPEFITETREVADFESVCLRDIGLIILEQGDGCSLTIEADPEIMPKIKSEVRDGKLTVQISRDWFERVFRGMGFFRYEHLKYRVGIKSVQSLEISGAGQIEAGEVRAEKLYIDISGQGDVSVAQLNTTQLSIHTSGQGNFKIAGASRDISIQVSGSGDIDLSGLQAENVKISISGRGNVKTTVSQTLEVNISGMGAVTYSGQPEITQNISGMGELVRQSGDTVNQGSM